MPATAETEPEAGWQLQLALHPADTADDDQSSPAAKKPWAWLLAHVFGADLNEGARFAITHFWCGAPLLWGEGWLALEEDSESDE